ncbi:GntR family transcriptional regulator [Rhizocola hellebori]|uniref:GntR family transcriptional regulator n=1 Tax=Rhizocola hellebori TaxID=1392758 RepID=A0A8J3Q9I4_9ACTN|nr:aminotransferase class I/II-fold pyridoxal phosphate-dependent enzyme [Rhizocola hellebori]GIH05525.1 GntR family transcriptional regulator [Rhizocola hellebori]
MLQLISTAVTDRGARGIAVAVSQLIHSGELAPGARLPTVRDLARELGTSPTTVSEAWSSLTRAGLIATRGRSGTIVLSGERLRARLRYSHMSGLLGGAAQDLSTGVPDHDLLPDLTDTLRRLGDMRLTTSYLDDPVLPALEEHLRASLPYPADQLIVVDGALDALDRTIGVVVRFGERVLVENPTFPPILDLLEQTGADPVGLPMDSSGIVPEALAEALRREVPVAVVLQPRAQNPTGVSMSAQRAAQLAEVLSGYPDVIIVEDDHAAGIASAPVVSLGVHLPHRTVHIRSFAKSLGPDLRLAAVIGPAQVISPLADRRLLGPGWSSRLLQNVLLDLLTAPSTAALLEQARSEYARRRAALLQILAQQGITATADDGINLWLEVADQQAALVSLAANAIAVAPGTPFEVTPLATAHLRVTAGLVREGFDELGKLLADAARAGGPERASSRLNRGLPRGPR